MLSTINILVQGKVQGVFYRQNTKSKAETLHISGFVKINKDGSVSIVATGEKNSLKALIDWCKKGPSRALVKEVSVADMPLNNFKGFEIVR